jgi:hypothetical protein
MTASLIVEADIFTRRDLRHLLVETWVKYPGFTWREDSGMFRSTFFLRGPYAVVRAIKNVVEEAND